MVKITDWVYSGFFENFDFFHIFNVISTIKIPKKSIFRKSPKITENDPVGIFFVKFYIFQVGKTIKQHFATLTGLRTGELKNSTPLKILDFWPKKKIFFVFFRFFFDFFFCVIFFHIQNVQTKPKTDCPSKPCKNWVFIPISRFFRAVWRGQFNVKPLILADLWGKKYRFFQNRPICPKMCF